jgi:protein SCO1
MNDNVKPLVSEKRINPWSIWVPIIMIVLGLVVMYNYLLSMQVKAQREEVNRPPITSRLEKDVEFEERSGKKVHLADLRGKMVVFAWTFTKCPRGCSGVAAKMKELMVETKVFGDVHYVSMALDEGDTVGELSGFAKNLGVEDGDPWWFVRGEQKVCRQLMAGAIGFRPVLDIPENERLSADDKYQHDLRVALVDGLGQVRGIYDLMSPDDGIRDFAKRKILADMEYIRKEQK